MSEKTPAEASVERAVDMDVLLRLRGDDVKVWAEVDAAGLAVGATMTLADGREVTRTEADTIQMREPITLSDDPRSSWWKGFADPELHAAARPVMAVLVGRPK